jgi:pyruvate dehydrogenase E1 component beta subunit
MPTVLESVSRTGRAVVVNYSTQFAGPGAEVAAQISHQLHSRLTAPVERVGMRFRPIPSEHALEASVYPDPASIADAVRTTMGAAR